MNEQKVQLVGIPNFMELLVRLIAKDLKIQKHLHHLTLSGAEISCDIQLHEEIFILLELNKEEAKKEIEEWYFGKIEESLLVDVLNDKNALAKSASEILRGLDRFRMQAIAKNKLGSS